MQTPLFQELMLPILSIAAEKERDGFSSKDLQENLSQILKSTEDEKNEMLSRGKQKVIVIWIAWAIIHLKKAGLIESQYDSYYKITPKGIDLINQKPETINLRLLEQYDIYKEWKIEPDSNKRNRRATDRKESFRDERNTQPHELMDSVYAAARARVAAQLKEKLKQSSTEFFENLVVSLLVKMGYGGSMAEVRKAVRKSADGGIEGIIKGDKLGLDKIYIQAKRWTNITVGRLEIQQFAGALQAQKAKNGIVLTTVEFSKEALDYVTQIGSNIILIDGEQLAELMIDNNLGVSVERTYEIKRMDSSFFAEE
jgi:restriction system protein